MHTNTPLQVTVLTYNVHCQLLSAKEILLVRLEFQDKQVGWGEVAPLSGFSSETFEEAKCQLLSVCHLLKSAPMGKDLFLKYLRSLNLYPSVHFGIESAFLAVVDPIKDAIVDIAALLMGPKQLILDQYVQNQVQNFNFVKLKVKDLNLEEALQIAADLNHKHKLRLDLNGKWTPHDERAFFERLPASSIDYIEEPSKDNLTYLKNRFLVAQDESCKNLASLSKVYDYFIYKPTIRGGYANFQKFINKNQKVVFSSAFESEIGLMQIAALSVRCANKFPLGLGTFCYNLTKIAPFKVVNGKLKVDSAIEPHKNIKLTQVFSSH